ncbi:hypothetical protein JCM5350_006414 [Sporobolomyces pararoseus]
MTSIATLQYGLTVRATGLITAAHAWTSLEPTFQFFDLLSLRKRRDTLIVQFKGSTRRRSLEKMLEELWGEIRKLITEEEVRLGEHEMLDEYRDYCGEPDCACLNLKETTWNKILSNLDEYLLEDLEQFFNDFCVSLAHASSPVLRLLSYFGLSHPLARLIPLNPDNPVDLNSVALIALPSRTDVGAYTTISGEHSETHNEHTLVDVSLKLPLDADSRFVRFIKLFNLQVVSTSISTLRVTTQPPTDESLGHEEEEEEESSESSEQKKIAGLKGPKDEHSEDIKPGWRLYTACDLGL